MNDSSHGLVGAYAADAVDDAERTEFEEHLRVCDDCRAEVASLHEATATIAETVPVAPPARLRASVMDAVAEIRPLPPDTSTATGEGSTPTRRSRSGPTLHAADGTGDVRGDTGGDMGAPGVDELAARRRGRRRAVLGVAAAAVVAVVGLGVTQVVSGPDLSPSERVLQADDALSSSVDLGGGARATVTHSESVGQSVIRTEDMPAPPAGSVYQLWYAEDDDFISAGLMPSQSGDQTVRLQGDSRSASGVGITVEPTGGSPAPTSEPIAMFDFGPAA